MYISLRFTFKNMKYLLMPVNLDPLLGTGFSFGAFLYSHALEGKKNDIGVLGPVLNYEENLAVVLSKVPSFLRAQLSIVTNLRKVIL